MTTTLKEPAPEALRTHFEALASDPSFKLSRSRRGTYVNPAVARDWKWFQLGAIRAQQPAPATSDWDVRGHLAASLTCWHRLTGQEADELVAMFKGRTAPLDNPPMPEHWGVVVRVNGDNILCIGESYLHGKRELSEAEENAVIGVAQHLLAFVGYGLPPSSFDPDADDAARTAAQPETAHQVATQPTAPSTTLPAERSLFKEQFRHLDLEEMPDAWGRPVFKHSHVDAIWHGWRQRAAIALLDTYTRPSPTAQAAPAAGAVAGPAEPTQEMIAAVLRLVDLGQSDPEDHRYDDGSKLATQICRAVIAAAPTPAAQADSVLEDADPIRALIAQHAAILDQNESAYFELAYHRVTGWMAWITDKPLCMPPVINPDRKVLAQGQGDTADEACADAALAQKESKV